MEEKFPRTGSKLNKNKKQKRYVLSEDKFDHIGAGMEASHRRSLRLLAVRGRVSKPSVRKAPELLKLGPYTAIPRLTSFAPTPQPDPVEV